MRRRLFLRSAAGTIGALAWPAFAAPYARTPRDYEGPYYPVEPRTMNNILVSADAARERFAGQHLLFEGEVVTPDGEPQRGITVDIWQADPDGRYKHPRDRSPGERYAEFDYFGMTQTDANGAFAFFTLLPGRYGWRPSHIHFKVWRDKKPLLTSQLYFQQRGGTEGKSMNAAGSMQTVSLRKGRATDVACFHRIVL